MNRTEEDYQVWLDTVGNTPFCMDFFKGFRLEMSAHGLLSLHHRSEKHKLTEIACWPDDLVVMEQHGAVLLEGYIDDNPIIRDILLIKGDDDADL